MKLKCSGIVRIALGASAALISLLLGGCITAKPSSSSAMIAPDLAVATKHAESVAVSVTGGSETSALGASKISNDDFGEAIKASLSQSKVFAAVLGGDAADYKLDVQIVKLDQPMFGGTFTVKLEVTWRLTQRSSQKLVWEKAVSSSGTATMGEAFAGVTRLRLATEIAARENIKDALTQLGALSLP